MLSLRSLAFAACSLAVVQGENHWAVLIAGSNGFGNYRHQADVCHAYHVLTSRGFHPDRIITMVYDDVAGSKMNPFPGKLYNFPWKTAEEAVDVYDGCQIDYRGNSLTPPIFKAVLMGDTETAGGKVLQSQADDHVFVNFVDHGAVGIIGFPYIRVFRPNVMHARELISTLQAMFDKGMYKQLVFYLETCESGSMFQGLLPEELPVYALTAANARESSWGTFCGPDDAVAGVSVGSCLGDLFSVNWMMDSDGSIKDSETLEAQYEKVKSTTTKSHVMQYGQYASFDGELVSDFEGDQEQMPRNEQRRKPADISHASAVDSRDAKLHSLYHRYLREASEESEDELIAEIEARHAARALGSRLTSAVAGYSAEQHSGEVLWTEQLLHCHHQATMTFASACGWSEENLPLSKVLYDLCEGVQGEASQVMAAIGVACAPAAEAQAQLVV